MDNKSFIEELSRNNNNDYPLAFKLLGLVVFIAQEGNEPLLTGEMISLRTYYRWAGKIKQAGYGNLLAEVQLRQAVVNFINRRIGDLSPDDKKKKVREAVEKSLEKI